MNEHCQPKPTQNQTCQDKQDKHGQCANGAFKHSSALSYLVPGTVCRQTFRQHVLRHLPWVSLLPEAQKAEEAPAGKVEGLPNRALDDSFIHLYFSP